MLNGNALVTGAGSGIGRAIALAYTRAGCTGIALIDLSPAGLKETVDLIKQARPQIKLIEVAADVSIEDEVQRMMAVVLQELGEIHYAANAAGISTRNRATTGDCPMDVYHKVNSVNSVGLLMCMQAEIKAMQKQSSAVTAEGVAETRAQKGSIVNLCSVAGLAGLQNIMPYVASKHAVLGITRSAALDHVKDGIRVNCICPGFINTPMLQGAAELVSADASDFGRDIPMKRVGLPEEIADVCVFLSSSMSSYMTGVAIPVDGGKMSAFSISGE